MTKTVLVTGVTGFLGGYVLDSFVKNGWKVKGTVRSLSKAAYLMERYSSHQVELVEVKDIAMGEGLEEALVGVDAIAHTASPCTLDYTDAMKEIISPAVDGTLAVLNAAKAAGVGRVVVTSSYSAAFDITQGGARREYTYTEADWDPVTLEQATAPGADGGLVYVTSKVLAERVALDFGNEHGLEVVTLLPSMVFGPPLHTGRGLNFSNGEFSALINGDKARPPAPNPFPAFVNAADCALAHVRAAEAPADKVSGKRFLVTGGYFTWVDSIRHLAKVRPELAARLPTIPDGFEDSEPIAKVDVTAAEKALGLTWQAWEPTLLATIDALVAAEKTPK